MDRRGFIAGSLLASVAASGIAAAPARAFGANRTVRLERFIIDERFADAREVGALIARRRVPILSFSADLTALWYDVLDLKWREAPESFGGMTTREGLFVLETLAADRGMRVVFRAQHALPGADGVRHDWSGPQLMRVPVQASDDWRHAWAQALLSVPFSASARSEAITTPPGDAQRNTTLYSWVIAPRTLMAARA